MIEIREKFIEYLVKKGFTKEKIMSAWEKAQTTIYTDYITLEVMTRDLLEKPEITEDLIKRYQKL